MNKVLVRTIIFLFCIMLTSCNNNKYVGEWHTIKVENNGIITLSINKDGKCIASESKINRKYRKFENGQWNYNDDHSITLSFNGSKMKGTITDKGLLQLLEIDEEKKFYFKKQ
jgi:hypothetical protein